MMRRVVQLIVGLPLYGVGDGLMIHAGFGVDPWTVFAQGLSVHTGVGVGWITNILGLLILLAWIPLRQKPGIGTIANILLVGSAMQATIMLLPSSPVLAIRIAQLISGILLVAVASGLYIGAHFGPGPRDGLMVGLHARLGWPIWLCRGIVEVTVLIAGWLLGGTVGIGTVLFAFGIGPLVGYTLPLLDTRRAVVRARRGAPAAPTAPDPSAAGYPAADGDR